ncbi:septum formation initiator [Nonlabens sp. YIK11]|uniref:FtsB family cell division protein n=1 Tax=Nonlabens sp. YIK11 TaxID=1453349 RepID=UPI0006DCF85F|nr:septum formation initiator [Nonlabens sp. YIK11]KQC33783.1 septum formation initiator [Nonlabens sp. YIK11]
MKWKEIKSKWYFNKYFIITILFAVWILFLDDSAWLTAHRALDQQIADKEQTADFYMRGIAADKARIQQLEDSAGIEKFGRERYLMKKENEEVYIIEYADSVKNED